MLRLQRPLPYPVMTGVRPGIGVALLTPDLFVTGAWPALAARFDELGLHLAAFAVVDATDATMASMYEGNTFKAGRKRVASTLGRKLPSLDMNVAVALAGQPETDVPALLDAAKGSSSHGSRQAGHLREAGRIAQRCMSLLHTPDPDLAGRDARILFGATADLLDPANYIPPSVIDDVRGRMCPADEPHPYDIVCRSIVRVATVLSLDARLGLANSVGELSSVVRDAKHLAASLRELPATQLTSSVNAGLCSIADLVRGVRLSPSATSQEQIEISILRLDLLRALTLLTDCRTWSERSGELVVAALRRSALFVSPWEEHMIVAALTFFPRPRG